MLILHPHVNEQDYEASVEKLSDDEYANDLVDLGGPIGLLAILDELESDNIEDTLDTNDYKRYKYF